jgi:phosphinothricin acetyltransferase
MIRIATKQDLEHIDTIYSQAITDGFHTAHTEPFSSQERLEWFQKYSEDDYPLFVYEKNNKVIGWVSVSPYRKGRSALNETVEISFYVDFNFHGKGIGTELVQHCLDQAEKIKKRVFLAIIIEGNDGSIKLLKKLGFEQWGFLPDVIHFRNQLRGQIYMGKVIQ